MAAPSSLCTRTLNSNATLPYQHSSTEAQNLDLLPVAAQQEAKMGVMEHGSMQKLNILQRNLKN